MTTTRTIAIGDIHGCSAALDALLDAIRPRPEDVIVTLGDYINRGPDTRGVSTGSSTWAAAAAWSRCWATTSRCSWRPAPASTRRPGWAWAAWPPSPPTAPAVTSPSSREEHFEFLEGCLDFHETDTHIFVHASYDPDLPMGEQPADLLRWESLRDGIPGPHRSGKAVIVGHTSQKGGEILDLGHVKCIDTFCYGGGWLTALDVRTGEVWQADREGKMREV